jgi:hypothetical protein
MSVIDDLRARIASGQITFDSPALKAERLRQELLNENSGTQATALLQALILEASRVTNIRISSIIRNEGHHGSGRAFDVGNEEVAATLLGSIATDVRVVAMRIDEIIFDAAIAGESDRNKWNYNAGVKYNYDKKTLDDHNNHIHFAVRAS